MSQGKRLLREHEELPYTLIGHSCLLSEFQIFLRGEGLKKIVENMREGEDLSITIHDKETPKFEIVDTHNKYPKTKPKRKDRND